MASIKSAKKRILVNETRAAGNKVIRPKAKTAVEKVDVATVAGDRAATQAQLISAITEIDKMATRDAYHKNTAPRKVSYLTKAVDAMA